MIRKVSNNSFFTVLILVLLFIELLNYTTCYAVSNRNLRNISTRRQTDNNSLRNTENIGRSNIGTNFGNRLREWTIMVFMAADNNLEVGTEDDINEMETVGSTEDVAILVQVDRIGEYSQNTNWKWNGAKRFLIKKDTNSKVVNSLVVQELNEIDSASIESLVDFVKWCKQTAPAKKYALILWNHGTGWKPISPDVISNSDRGLKIGYRRNIMYNISYDDTSNTSMDIPSLEKALSEINKILGQKIDLLGFDACLMQMLEVAVASYKYAKYQVGSVDLEPERGWPYNSILKKLASKPTIDAKQLGKIIVDEYVKSYNNGSQGNVSVTLSLLDLSNMDQFLDNFNAFCKVLSKSLSKIDLIESIRKETLKYVYTDYLDLGHFLNIVISKFDDQNLIKAALNAYKSLISSDESGLVISNKVNGTKFKDSRGISIYFPDRAIFKPYKTQYSELSISKITKWFEFLQNYEKPDMAYLMITDIILEDANHDNRIAPGENVKVKLKIKNLGKQKAKNVKVYATTSSKYLNSNEFSATISNSPTGGSEEVVEAFNFTVKVNAPENSEVALLIKLTADGIVSSKEITFFIKSNFTTQGSVLLVVTDQLSDAPPILQNMLNSNNIKYDLWDRSIDGEINFEVLKKYENGWIIVSSQNSSNQQQLSEKEITALEKFLQIGGRVVFSGQDLAFALRESSFLQNYCKIKFVQDDTNIHVVSGCNGFAGNNMFQIYGGDGANNQKWPDEIDPLPGAKVIMKYNQNARDLANEDEMNGPNIKPGSKTRAIKSSGTAAVAVNNGYKIMFFAFGIEAINNASQRSTLISEIAKFMAPPIENEIKEFATSKSLLLSENVNYKNREILSHVEDRLFSNVRIILNKQPNKAESILKSIQSLTEKERQAISSLEREVIRFVKFNHLQK